MELLNSIPHFSAVTPDYTHTAEGKMSCRDYNSEEGLRREKKILDNFNLLVPPKT